MNKAELYSICEQFGIQLGQDYNDTTRKEMIALLKENGVTKASYEELVNKEYIEPPEKDDSYDDSYLRDIGAGTVLVGTSRKNSFFQFMKYRFDQNHKFVPMKEEDAQLLINSYPGFFKATREDIKNFYS